MFIKYKPDGNGELKPKSWVSVGLVILSLCIAGLIGYKLGSDRMNDKWITSSQKVLPVVFDFVLDEYEKMPSHTMFIESNKELIKSEATLLFIDGTYMLIDLEGYLGYMEQVNR